MNRIESIKARQILDSRGNPTIEVEIRTKNAIARAAAPSGASCGSKEATELRDGGKDFHGKSVRKAIENVHNILAPALTGMNVEEQEEIDWKIIKIDGTKDKRVIGGNACVATSIACCKCAAENKKIPIYLYLNKNSNLLPIPFMNIINGGKHAGNELAVQEFMIAPTRAKNFSEAIMMGCEVYYSLKDILMKKYGKYATNVGDEGGFAPPLKETKDALELIMDAIEENNYGNEVMMALDCAASSFYKDGFYYIEGKKNSDELIDFYNELVRDYPIISIEDPFSEDDWQGFVKITKKMGNRLQIVGDDVFVTNSKKLREGIKKGACNALILKPNQAGTLTETMEIVKICSEYNYSIMVSHRSGDTCDSFIADLSVAIGAGQIKAGAPCRAERTEKYNQLLRIEEKIEKPIYAGRNWKKLGY